MSAPAVIKFCRARDAYGELSNFWKSATPLVWEGRPFASSEHLYQYMKFAYEGASEASRAYAEQIRTASTAYKAKLLANQRERRGSKWAEPLNAAIAAGRAAGVQLRPGWDAGRDDVMRLVLFTKFRADAHCRAALLDTGAARLVEHSPADRYWADGGDGRGANKLGLLLEEVRAALRATHPAPPAVK